MLRNHLNQRFARNVQLTVLFAVVEKVDGEVEDVKRLGDDGHQLVDGVKGN